MTTGWADDVMTTGWYKELCEVAVKDLAGLGVSTLALDRGIWELRAPHCYAVHITFLLPETTQARNDVCHCGCCEVPRRNLSGLMGSSSCRAAFEPRPHQGASWPSTAGLTSSSRLWLLRRRAARGEFGPHSRRPEKKLLHPTPPAAVPIPVCLEISPT